MAVNPFEHEPENDPKVPWWVKVGADLILALLIGVAILGCVWVILLFLHRIGGLLWP